MRYFAVRREASSPHVDGYAFETNNVGTIVIWMAHNGLPSGHETRYQEHDMFVKATVGMELREIAKYQVPTHVVERVYGFSMAVNAILSDFGYRLPVDNTSGDTYNHIERDVRVAGPVTQIGNMYDS